MDLGGWKEREQCDRREVGRWDGVEEHFGEGGRKVAGLHANGLQGSGDPDKCCGWGEGVAKLVVIGEVIGVKLEVFVEPQGSREGTWEDPVG